MNERRSNEAGYTLVELLVVILLLGFIALAIGGSLHFGARVWVSAEERVSHDNMTVQAQTMLRLLFATALPRTEGGFVTFEGTSTHVAFDAAPLAALNTGGISHVDIEIVPQAGRRTLRLRARAIAGLGRIHEAVLMDDVGPAQFAFLDSQEDAPTWLASWRARQRLPDAVGLSTEQGAIPNWPAFIARLPIGQTALCAFDPVSYSCRGGG